MAELTAWGLKRLDDMTYGELVEALRQMHRSYMAVLRSRMSPPELQDGAPAGASFDDVDWAWLFGETAGGPSLPDDVALLRQAGA